MRSQAASHDQNWTIAYRKPQANRFQRVQNLATDWTTATKIGDAFKVANPSLQVYTCTTKGYDEAHPSEDSFNLLVDSGKRVKITDNAPDLGVEFLDLQPTFHAEGGSKRVSGELTTAELGELCQGHTPFQASSFRCAGRDGQPDAAVHAWTPTGHERRVYCGYHSPFDLTTADREFQADNRDFTAPVATLVDAPPVEDEFRIYWTAKPRRGMLVTLDDGTAGEIFNVGSRWLRGVDFKGRAFKIDRRLTKFIGDQLPA